MNQRYCWFPIYPSIICLMNCWLKYLYDYQVKSVFNVRLVNDSEYFEPSPSCFQSELIQDGTLFPTQTITIAWFKSQIGDPISVNVCWLLAANTIEKKNMTISCPTNFYIVNFLTHQWMAIPPGLLLDSSSSGLIYVGSDSSW